MCRTQLDKHIRNEELMKNKSKKLKTQKKLLNWKKPRKLNYKGKKIIQNKSEIKKLLLINLANDVKHR